MTATTARIHDGLACHDVEALLAETSADNEVLRDRLGAYEAADAARQVEMDDLRAEAERIRAVLTDLRKKTHGALDERGALDEQMHILLTELQAAEQAAVPADTLAAATVSHADLLARYRRASLVTRGPLPPSVTAAVQNSLSDIQEAMVEAGQAALEEVVRREVRRRRASSRPVRRSAA
jgi:chromosome segregation ATPase